MEGKAKTRRRINYVSEEQKYSLKTAHYLQHRQHKINDAVPICAGSKHPERRQKRSTYYKTTYYEP